jgi:hypothetical protein
VSRRTFLHVGLPKTGTSFLQKTLWAHRDLVRAHGLLLPGREKRDHLLSSMIVRDDPGVARRGPGAGEAWRIVREQAAAYDGDVLVSHEFFCAATAEQAARAVAELPGEVHLVVTAREPLALLGSSWQESLKNLGTTRLEDYGRTVSEDPRDVWNWRALDLGLVLERWGPTVPAPRVHVLPLRPGAPREDLWARFCGVVGLDPALLDVADRFANSSMGLVEAETLRRLNERLPGRWSAQDRGRWLRSFVADQRLVPRGGDRFLPTPAQVADCRARAERAVAHVRAAGYDVVGDVADLRVPDTLPELRGPGSVTDAEVAAVALDLAAALLDERRRLVVPPAERRQSRVTRHIRRLLTRR